MYDRPVLGALTEAIDELELPVDAGVLREALRLLDRLTAKVTAAVGEVDAAELWELDGAHSMSAWLRHRAGMTGADAHRVSSTAKRLRDCPRTRAAWLDGALGGGQVRTIVANLSDDTAALYAAHEPDLVPRLCALDGRDTVTAMRSWADAARDAVDRPSAGAPERRLHLSRTLGGRGELTASFDAEGHRGHRHGAAAGRDRRPRRRARPHSRTTARRRARRRVPLVPR